MGKKQESESEPENDSDYGEDMLDMIDGDDLDFLKSAVTSKSYSIYNKVRYTRYFSIKLYLLKFYEYNVLVLVGLSLKNVS